MTEFQPSTPWRNSFSPYFLTLLALMTLDHVVRVPVFVDGEFSHYTSARQAHHVLRARAAQLAAREFHARVQTSDRHHAGWGSLEALISSGTGGGATLADWFRDVATKGANHYPVGGVVSSEAQTPGARAARLATYEAELVAVTAGTTELLSLLAASFASDVALDDEFGSSLAAGIESDYDDARAAYVAELQTAWPSRGFT